MIYPNVFPHSENVNKAERTVYQYLEQLKDQYDIFYSKRFLAAADGEKPEYEIDFIISKPRKWILVLEVKGGLIEYDGESNSWLQANRRMGKSPNVQATGAAHSLVNRYPNLSKSIPIGWALCFPDCELPVYFSNPTNISKQLIIDRNKLLDVKSAVDDAMSVWKSHYPDKNGCRRWEYDSFKKSLLRGIGFVQKLQTQIKHDEAKFIQLTDRQLKIFRRALNNKRLIVTGPAGSGKTILAKTIAEEFAESGRSVLLMCYNRTLSKKLRYDTSSRYNDNLDVTRFHQFARHKISDVDEEWWDKQDKESDLFWEVDIAIKLSEVSSYLDKRYDVMIFDEAQDFNELWFEALNQYSNNNDDRQILFFDEKQNIFDRDLDIPYSSQFTSFELLENCRNTKTIIDFLSEIIDSKIDHFDDSPIGDKVDIYQLDKAEDLQQKLKEIVLGLLKEENLSNNQIILLLNSSKSESSIKDLDSIGNYKVRSLPDNARFYDNTIHYSHIQTYKGLESDVVIILDARNLDEAVLYTEASRAKHKLIILKLA